MMNKSLLFLLVIFFFILFGCKQNEAVLPRKSIGKINTIAVIIDDRLWIGEVGELFRNTFASPVLGLHKEEPLFTINQYSDQLMKGLMINHRTVIVVKKDKKACFFINKNKYAYPQQVFHISGRTTQEILDIVTDNSSLIISMIKSAEIADYQRTRLVSLSEKFAFRKIFNISLSIPPAYKLAFRDKKFVWFKKNLSNGNCNLLLYELPLTTLKGFSANITDIIKIRDSIGQLYIHGTEKDSRMITEEGYSPYFLKLKLDDKIALETKGTWEMKNDFMSGAFINYVIFDQKHQRVICLEGFCYSPSRPERDLIFELEAIIKSVAFLN